MGEDSKDERFGADSIEVRMRERIRDVIEKLVEEELDEALGAGKSERVEGRHGYRHGSRERTLTTSLGATSFAMPRARVGNAAGVQREWQSQVVPRYQRRTARVDEAIARLSDEHRTVIVMRELDGMEYHEIAEAVGCSIGTVMSRLFYARKKLQTMLRDVHEQL